VTGIPQGTVGWLGLGSTDTVRELHLRWEASSWMWIGGKSAHQGVRGGLPTQRIGACLTGPEEDAFLKNFCHDCEKHV